jgi:hypothetical protein
MRSRLSKKAQKGDRAAGWLLGLMMLGDDEAHRQAALTDVKQLTPHKPVVASRFSLDGLIHLGLRRDWKAGDRVLQCTAHAPGSGRAQQRTTGVATVGKAAGTR